MKQFKTLISKGLGLMLVGSTWTCDYVQEMWHTPFAANIQEHHSPTPPHNMMVVEEHAAITGEVHDTFAQEDQSTIDGSGNDRVYTDRPLEDYLGSLVGSPDPKHQTYKLRTTRPFREAFRPLTKDDVFGNQAGHGYYSLKLTNGMVYKTDQTQCNTPYQHPVTMHEESGNEDHDPAVADGGDYQLTDSDKYCFFLYQPSNGNHEALVARVHEEDENSLGQIKEGITPYMQLESSLLPKLASNEAGDFKWVKGRYVLPMPAGKMIVPRNGTNLTHNRVTVYRPYHQDVMRQSAGSTASAQLLATLSNSFPAARTDPGQAAPEFFPIDGLSSRAAGIEYSDALHARGDEPRYGSKLSSWGEFKLGQYLALGPDDSNPKRLNWALHFPTAEAEQEYLQKVSSGAVDVNSNRSAGDSGTGERPMESSEINQKLSPEVLFQLSAQGVYTPGEVTAGGGNYDPNTITSGDETVTCEDERIKPWCDKYRPFHAALVSLYESFGINEVAGAGERFEQILQSAPLNRSINVGGKSFVVSTPRMTIGNFENDHKFYFDQLDVTIEGSDAFRHDYNWILFMTRERTIGMDMDNRLVKLKAALASDYERLAQANFPGTQEESFLLSKEQTSIGGCGLDETCMTTEIKSLLDTRYIPIETNKIVSGAFLYHTSQTESGRRVLSHLALLQQWLSYPGANISWRNLLPAAFQGCSRGNMAPCMPYLQGGAQAPVRSPEDYKNLRFDPDKEPFIKLGT